MVILAGFTAGRVSTAKQSQNLRHKHRWAATLSWGQLAMRMLARATGSKHYEYVPNSTIWKSPSEDLHTIWPWWKLALVIIRKPSNGFRSHTVITKRIIC